MKIIHTADWHLGKTLCGRSRRTEQEEFLEFLVQETESYEADLILIAGDIYDNGNPPAWAEELFYRTVMRLSGDGKRLVLVIAGNHDSPERLEAAIPLARKHGIIICGYPRTVTPVGACGKQEVLQSGEGWMEVKAGREHAVILTIPYPSEKRLNEFLYPEGTEEKKAAAYAERMKEMLDGLAVHFREDTVNLLVTHLFAMASLPGGSEQGIQLGGSYLIDGRILPARAQYMALGHVHRPQTIPGTNHRGWYAGAPMAYHRQEAQIPVHSFYRLEIHPGESVLPEAVPIPCSKPIVSVHCVGIEAAKEWCRDHREEDSWVFLDVETDRYIREEEIREMRKDKDGLIEVHPIFPEQGEEESEECRREKSFEEQFREFYRGEKGVEAAPELVKLLLDVLGEEETDETAADENQRD
ncbi:MAG: exonuclease subunit SbcD [Clostridiales bacterium]|nr:exonuclease subunit SbcD [Clostridiales bacterium]